MGLFEGSKWEKGRTWLALKFGVKKMPEKKGKGQIRPLYRDEGENSLAVRLKPFAINDLDCPRVSTIKIKRPFEI